MPVTSPRASARGFPVVPISWSGLTEEWVRLVAEVVRSLQDGKILATGNVTLTASAATTTLSDRRIGPNSVILLMPTTANAAAALATTYISARTNESATITHANNAQSNKTFGYAVLG